MTFSLLPEILMALGALALLLTGLFWREGVERLCQLTGTALLIGTLLLFFILPDGVYFSSELDPFLIHDALALTMQQFLLGGAGILLIFWTPLIREEKLRIVELPALLLFSLLGMMLMTGAKSLLTLGVALELMTLPTFILLALRRDALPVVKSALTYFLLTSFATIVLLYGIVLLWGAGHSLAFEAFGSHPHLFTHPLPLLGFLMCLAGLAFKLGWAPLHWWIPDVYRYLPWSVVAFLSTLPKLALVILLTRFMSPFLGTSGTLLPQVLTGLAMASLLIGAFGGLRQRELRSWLAYSGITQLGYIAMGFAVGTPLGVTAALSYALVYFITMLVFFGLFLYLPYQGQGSSYVRDLSLLPRYSPLRALSLSVILFSLAGVPPLPGFFVKVYLIEAALHNDCIALAIVSLLATVVAAFYYLNVVRVMYFEEREANLLPIISRPRSRLAHHSVTFTLVGLMGLLGIFWTPWVIPWLHRLTTLTTALF